MLALSKTAGKFTLSEDGTLLGASGKAYDIVVPEPVTNLRMGDWNHDGGARMRNGLYICCGRQCRITRQTLRSRR